MAAFGVLHPMLLHGGSTPLHLLANPLPPFGAGYPGVDTKREVQPALLFSPMDETDSAGKGVCLYDERN